MTTATAEQQFTQTYGPYATQDASIMGIPAQVILGQWGMETADGTQQYKGSDGTIHNVYSDNNPGNIMDSNGNPIHFKTMADFNQEYINTVENDFPKFNGRAYAGWSPNASLQSNLESAFNGPQKYDPSVQDYGDKIYNGMVGQTSQPGGTPSLGSGTPNSSTPPSSGASASGKYTGFAGAIKAIDTFENPPSNWIANFAGIHPTAWLDRGIIVACGLIILFIGVFGLATKTSGSMPIPIPV